ncbi:MAG: uncharacterized protein JWM87_2203, partial [Candidatus Eremiobacteraeota bacterium]|nr:uncharacterized protein [Candidatus Eremiobacteraeota bacterium]
MMRRPGGKWKEHRLALDDPVRSSTLQIALLGGLRLVEHGRELKFSAPAKAASLLAYLLVHRAQHTARDTIAFTFWPDDDEARARANLRRHIALIVHALPADSEHPALIADARTIRWNPEYPCSLDIAEFERLSGDHAGAEAAVALYRGDVLPAAYDEWILPERERFRSLHGRNLERLTERYAAAGDYAHAIASARM